jgi:hypothetical protein
MFAACALFAAPVASAASPLIDRIEQADGIVIARAATGPVRGDSTEFTLTVASVLKGPSPGPTVAVTVPESRRPQLSADLFEPVCGIFFLQRRSGRLTVLPPAGRVLANFGAYIASDRCSAAPADDDSSPVADRVVKEILRAVELGAPDPFVVLRLFTDIRPADSAQIAAASVRFSSMSDVNLRLLGLAWRVGEGNAAAMRRIGKEVSAADHNSPREVIAATAIAAYSNSDPDGVNALGAIGSAVPGGQIEQAVSEALRSIHSRESLAYAVRMLDSRNSRVRENAIAALSMFVMDIPILNDGNRHEALERGLNPARRKKLDPEVEKHVRLGPLSNAESEMDLIAWWKGWYRQTIE